MRDISSFLSSPCFALYRLPRTGTVHIISATNALSATDIADLVSFSKDNSGSDGGFVIAPYDKSRHETIFIPAQKRTHINSITLPHEPQLLSGYEESDQKRYMDDFALMSEQLKSGRALKVVLARKVRLRLVAFTLDILRVFGTACQMYPNNFIALWNTSQTGTWLTATPELLLSRSSDDRCHTMALAGTMPLSNEAALRMGGWDAKNFEEQRYVQQHIFKVLGDLSLHYDVSDTRIVRSGDLLHLCTDFRFPTPQSVGLLLDWLHPTPAVCGLPAKRAHSLIAEQEHIERDYYAGYSGPINPDGTFGLYVTLRCLHLVEQGCDLYAGSGLLAESNAYDEWQETEGKLDSLRKLIPLRG